jgi:hypothetical protein
MTLAAAETAAPEEAPPEKAQETPTQTLESSATDSQSMTFDTRELEGIGKTIDLGKDRLDKIIEVLSEKSAEAAKPGPEIEKAPAPKPETTVVLEAETTPPPEKKTGTLPPWADQMKGVPSPLDREDTAEKGHVFGRMETPMPKEDIPAKETRTEDTDKTPAYDTVEEEIFPRHKPSDSGLGYPERLTQAILPFGPDALEQGEEAVQPQEAAEETEEMIDEPVVTPVEPAIRPSEETRPALVEREAAEGRPGVELETEEEIPPPFQFSMFLKSKAFDGLFIGVFWLLALWLAASSMGTTLFGLLSVTAWSLLLLYAILVGLYFFLFKFFLGETLGDRLFKDRE